MFAAVQFMCEQEPPVAAATFGELQRTLYWKKKDMPRVVAVSLAGITCLLSFAHREPDVAAANDHLGKAKAMAFNLGSFAWPGWDEPGITLTPQDRSAGRDAAKLNLRLAERLDRPDKAKAAAHWLVGAHHLSDARYADAISTFAVAADHARRGGDAAQLLMLDGYASLSRLCAAPAGDAAASDAFQKSLDALRSEGSEDAIAYVEQLAVAQRVFGQRG